MDQLVSAGGHASHLAAAPVDCRQPRIHHFPALVPVRCVVHLAAWPSCSQLLTCQTRLSWRDAGIPSQEEGQEKRYGKVGLSGSAAPGAPHGYKQMIAAVSSYALSLMLMPLQDPKFRKYKEHTNTLIPWYGNTPWLFPAATVTSKARAEAVCRLPSS